MSEISLNDDIVQFAAIRHLQGKQEWLSSGYNVFLLQNGKLKVTINRHEDEVPAAAFYSTGSVVLQAADNCDFILIVLSPKALIDLCSNTFLLEHPLTSFASGDLNKLLGYAKEYLLLSESPTAATRWSRKAAIMNILQILINTGMGGSDPDRYRHDVFLPRKELLIESIQMFLTENCLSDISQIEVAKHFRFSPQYLGRLIKEKYGMNFRSYLAELKNQKLLSYRQYSVSSSNKIIPSLPGDDKTAFSNGIIKKPESGSICTVSSDNLCTIKTIHTSIRLTKRTTRAWLRLINLGYAATLDNMDLGASLQKVQREIGFQYGRICRITDLLGTYVVNGQTHFDFSGIFSLLNLLHENEITPFLELGNKSFSIQEAPSLSYIPVSPEDTKKYYDNLIALLPDFIRACINHYGQEYFDSWYFEISYMYTDQNAREKFGFVNYAYVFLKIHKIIRKFSRHCQIGGPGFNDWSDISKISSAIEILTSYNAVPDFFSAYIYPITLTDDHIASTSEDPDIGTRRIEQYTNIIHKYYPLKEVWITEYNSNLSSRNFLNDSCYQAAYIAKMALQVSSLKISSLGYYLLSDLPLRHLDTIDLLFGGWGLLSDSSLPKPSYHVYQMLAKLGPYLIKSDKHCLIAADAPGSFQILLYQYCHPKDLYLHKNVGRDDLQHSKSLYNTEETLRYSIVIDGIPEGTYIIKTYRINKNDGNIYTLWSKICFLRPYDDSTLHELLELSDLKPEISGFIQNDEFPLNFDILLHNNEVCMITVTLNASNGSYFH